MTEITDITGRLLADIRDEIRGTNTRLDSAVARLDAHERILLRMADELGGVNGRLDTVNGRLGRLERGQERTNERLATIATVLERLADRANDFDEQGARIDAALDEVRRKVELLERRHGP
jgi:chromosome segregation ATPase